MVTADSDLHRRIIVLVTRFIRERYGARSKNNFIVQITLGDQNIPAQSARLRDANDAFGVTRYGLRRNRNGEWAARRDSAHLVQLGLECFSRPQRARNGEQLVTVRFVAASVVG
jgi:hypothetical protein